MHWESAIKNFLRIRERITRHGKDVAIVIEPSLYETLLEAQEELEDIAAFDKAMAETEPTIPWIQVQKDLKLL